ncbi:unnamed protein product [Brassica oleracea]
MKGSEKLQTKPNSKRKSAEFVEPGSRSLFQTIHGFAKKTQMIWMILIHKTCMLPHVDCFTQIAMEESMLNIKLTISHCITVAVCRTSRIVAIRTIGL